MFSFVGTVKSMRLVLALAVKREEAQRKAKLKAWGEKCRQTWAERAKWEAENF